MSHTIRVYRYRNVFSLSDRGAEMFHVEQPAVPIGELYPGLDLGSNGVLWINGRRIAAGNPVVRADDDLTLVTTPGLAAVAGLHWAWQLVIAGAFLVGTSLVARYLGGKAADAVGADQDSNNTGFQGFRNAYEEGSVVPVVYGHRRVAGVVLNQEIAVAQGPFFNGNAERLRILYALSEGPIAGLGKYLTPIASHADWQSATGIFGGPIEANIGLQVNGQDAGNYFSTQSPEWRTGELDQEPIGGFDDVTTAVEIDQDLPMTLNATETDVPAGTYSSGFITGVSGDYVTQTFTSSTFDRLRVELFAPRGIYTASAAGSYTSSQADVRIQYRPVDSGGSPTGNMIVLPTVTVKASSPGPIAYDVDVPLFDPTTYTPPQLGGYYAASGRLDNKLQLVPAQASVLPDNFSDRTALKFAADCWVRPSDLLGNSPSCGLMFSRNGAATITGTETSFPWNHLTKPNSWGLSWRLVADQSTAGTPVYLILEGWNGTDPHVYWLSPTVGNASALDGTWHHVGVNYDATASGNRVQFYFDGVEIPGTSFNYLASRRPRISTNRVFWGRNGNAGSNKGDYSEFDITDIALYNGTKPLSYFNARATEVNQFGLNSRVLTGGEAELRMGCNVDAEFGSTGLVKNLAQPNNVVAGVAPALSPTSGLRTAPQSDAPLQFAEQGTPTRGRYLIEVFRSNSVGANPSGRQDEIEVKRITLVTDQDFEYPATATLATDLLADEQVNNERPVQTVDVYGRIVDVWTGDDVQFPTFKKEWTDTNAWIAADVATHPRFGLGGIFKQGGYTAGIDWSAFQEWADYTDEGVEDGFGALSFFNGTVFGPSSIYLNGTIQFDIGLVDASFTTVATIPRTWRAGYTLGIKTASTPQWTTVAKNVRLPLVSLTYVEDSTAANGYTQYVTILCEWSPDLNLPTKSSVTGTVVGFEKRCRFDHVYDKHEDGWEALFHVYRAGRAVPFILGNRLSVYIDKPREVAAIVTQANVIAGSVEMTWTGIGDRPNRLEVDYDDELTNYEKQTQSIADESIVSATALDDERTERISMVGITRLSQVLRDARVKLNQNRLLLRRVKFKLGPDSIPLLPGTRFVFSHDVPIYGTSGRMLAEATVSNLNRYPEDILGSLTALGGDAQPLVAWAEFSGFPHTTSSTRDSNYTVPGPFGYGSADFFRARTFGTGKEEASFQLLGQTVPTTATYVRVRDKSLSPGGNPGNDSLDRVDDTDWSATVACFFRDPDIGGDAQVRLEVFSDVDDSGTATNRAHGVTFAWSSGVLSVSSTDGGATGEVQAPATTGANAGWYRAILKLTYADANAATGLSVGDHLSVRYFTNYYGTDSYVPGGQGGKGVNFFAYGDPTDVTQTSVWTAINVTGTPQTAILPPFHADQLHGTVALITSDVADGTTAKLSQRLNIAGAGTTYGSLAAFGSISGGNTTGESFYTTVFVRGNTATKTRIEVTNGTDNTVCDITWSGPTLTVTGSTGAAATLTAAVLNSSSSSSDWYQLNITLVNSTGSTFYDFNVYPEYVATGATGLGAYIWGMRSHGEDSGGGTFSPYFHRGVYMFGLEYFHGTASTTRDYQPGDSIFLDRDVTLEAGESYEVYARPSLVSRSGSDIVETVPVLGTQVPSSGSTTITAGSELKLGAPFKAFIAQEGDLYRFGKLSAALPDFSVVSITTDPSDLSREVVGIEYNEAVYDDTTSIPTGSSSVSSAVSGGVASIAPQAVGGAGGVVTAQESTDFDGNGRPRTSVLVTWSRPRDGSRSRIGGYRVYVSPDTRPYTPELVADVSPQMRHARVARYPFDLGSAYRFFVQAYGPGGAGRSPSACPSTSIKVWGAALVPSAPVVEWRARRGDETSGALIVDAANSHKASSYESRVGGWLLGQPLLRAPGVGIATGSGYISGPNDSSGQPPAIITRGIMPTGQVSAASIERITSPDPVVGSTTTSAVNLAGAWGSGTHSGTAEVLASPTSPIPGYLHFSGSALTATWTSATVTMSKAARYYVVAYAEAVPILAGLTLGSMKDPIGSRRYAHWTLEGPVSGPEVYDNLGLTIEWDPSETTTPTGNYTKLTPGVAFFRSTTFRITLERPTAGDDIHVYTFGYQILDLAKYDPDDFDGGTF